MKRAAIYARVSTLSQKENYSIRTQIEQCTKYALDKGYTIVGDQYVDPETGNESASGNGSILAYVDAHSSLELSRPGLDAVYDYLDEFGFDVFIVYAIDRLDRDPVKLHVHEYGFKKKGAEVEYVTGNYADTPEGKFMKNVIASAAQLENDWRTERCNRGKRKKARMGLFVGGRPPFGYKIDPETPGGLAVIEEEAEVVRNIFRLFVSDSYSIRGIAKEMKWAKSSIGRLLHNPAYIGQTYYNKNKRDEKLLSPRSKDDWISIPIKPIIDEPLFKAAKNKLDWNRNMKRSSPQWDYFLSGMIICEECGKAYYCETVPAGRNGRINDAPIYRHRISQGHCRNKQFSARIIDKKVWHKITQLLLAPETLRDGYQQALDRERSSQKRQREFLEEYCREKVKLDKRKDNLLRAYTDPDIGLTKADYLKERAKVDDDLDNLTDRITDIEKQLSKFPTPQEFESLESFSMEIRGRISNPEWKPSLQNRRKVLQLLHIQVILGEDGHGKIAGWFGEINGVLSQSY